MYVLARQDSGSYPQLTTYESMVPKDVVSLHPGSEVSVLMRCVFRAVVGRLVSRRHQPVATASGVDTRFMQVTHAGGVLTAPCSLQVWPTPW
jgi:hypothetical protein